MSENQRVGATARAWERAGVDGMCEGRSPDQEWRAKFPTSKLVESLRGSGERSFTRWEGQWGARWVAEWDAQWEVT